MLFCNYPIIGAESSLPIYLVSVGMYNCQPHTVRRDGHPNAQIFYCTKGSGRLEVNGLVYDIEPMDAFIMPDGIPHEYYPTDDVWDIRWIEFSGESCEKMLSSLDLYSASVFALPEMGLLEHYFRRMHESLSGDSIFGNYRASGYLYDFIIEFHRLTGRMPQIGTYPAVVRAVDYIGAHFAERITLDGLSAEAGVSPQHLCRLFRSAMGCRPMEYLAKRRIQEAKSLLADSALSMEEIAERTGFCDSSYFGRLFRRYEGISPGKFRTGR